MKVLFFVEKPSTKTQKEQLKKGKTYINSGIYMFCPDTFMSEMKKCASSVYKIISEAQLADTMPTVDLNTYDKLPDISIDYALMEKTKKSLEGEDLEEIKKNKDELLKKANELATKVYEEAAKQNKGTEESSETKEETHETKKDDDVVDAEYAEKST